jgi:hypothetical protein
MDQQTAQLALQFMNRVQLQGSEVSAWLQVVRALQAEGAKDNESEATQNQSQPND